mmetsp:Transcript_11821/g.38718  ORF Transcript_11821/g.38718 Transcript_11821/m.38718 type:complete len:198 (+) Transcript_11821:120-713(+)
MGQFDEFHRALEARRRLKEPENNPLFLCFLLIFFMCAIAGGLWVWRRRRQTNKAMRRDAAAMPPRARAIRSMRSFSRRIRETVGRVAREPPPPKPSRGASHTSPSPETVPHRVGDDRSHVPRGAAAEPARGGRAEPQALQPAERGRGDGGARRLRADFRADAAAEPVVRDAEPRPRRAHEPHAPAVRAEPVTSDDIL